MAAPDSEERKLIEHCKNYIVACGVLRGIQYENIASMQDAIKKIADAYQVDLTTGEGRKKFQEGCRKAAYEYLEEEGIIAKDDVLGKNLDGTDKITYHIVPGKEQDYKDAIYRAEYQRKNARNLGHFLAAAEKAKDTGDFLMKCVHVLGLSPKPAIRLFGHVVAFASKVSDMADQFDETKADILKRAAQAASNAVYGTVDHAEELQKGIENAKDAASKVAESADEILYKQACTPTNSIQESCFTKRMKRSVNKTYERIMTPHPERRQKAWEMAETLRHITDGRQEDIFAAFADLDEVIRPGQKKITKDDVSQSVKDDTKFRLGDINPFLESVCRTPELIRNELTAMKSFRFLNKLTKRRSERLATCLMPEPVYLWYRNRLARKESVHYERAMQKASIKNSSFDQAQLGIAHFNATHREQGDSQARGANYAYEYAGLNVYRCGRSGFLVSSMHLFRMNTLDRIWAMAYMKAGMIESVQGVRYIGRPKDEASMEYGRSEVRRKAEEVFHSYVDGKPMHELSRVCDQMEADFITEHSAMIDRIAAERERQGLTPLQEVSHINQNFDNARDDGKKDQVDVEVVDAVEFDGLDVTALRKTLGKDGFFIRDNGSVALYLFQEDKGVVALVDEWKNITDMRLTLDGYHRNNETKDVFKKRYKETRDGLRTDSALHNVGAKIQNKDVMEILRGKWEPFIADALKNGCEAKTRSTEHGTVLELADQRTGITMDVCEQDPEPGYHGTTVMNFAKRIAGKEFWSAIQEAELTENDIDRCMIQPELLSTAERKILATVDHQGQLEALTKQTERFLTHVDAEEILHIDRREKAIAELKEMFTPERADKLRAIAENYQQKLQDYRELSRTDPVLACCRIVVPNCERTERGVIGHTDNGAKFGLTTNGRPLFSNDCPPQVLQKIVEMQEAVVQLGAVSYDAHGCFVRDEVTPKMDEPRNPER